jgi:hypothetical protein
MTLQGTMGDQRPDFSPNRYVNAGPRVTEAIACASIIIVLLIVAFAIEPVRTGDGHYYFGMLEGLARNGSPALTDEVRASVKERLGRVNFGMTLAATDGQVYGWHFFAYPLFCLPAYRLLQALHADGLKAFQLTNALIIAVALCYVLLFSRLSVPARWLVAAGFLFSTGTIYFQWTHPEVFSAALVLMASIAVVDRRYALAAFMAAVGSLQNPSIALMILPILIAQGFRLSRDDIPNLFARRALVSLSLTVFVSLIALVPYIWNYLQFGTPNVIVSKGAIDYSNINLRRLVSFMFDLNQGLVIGLPLLLWAMPFALAFRAAEAVRGTSRILRREDLLLLGFLLMVLPTLGQVNWNGGHSVFLRYGAWAGMAPLVWVAVTIGRQGGGWLAAGLVPAITVQLAMALSLGGVSVQRLPSYVHFRPWVLVIWNFKPHIYNPLPEIFYERLVNREVNPREIPTPAVLRGHNEEIIRVLTHKKRIEDVAEEVCGPGGNFEPWDQRHDSEPKMSETERGFRYVTGRFACR